MSAASRTGLLRGGLHSPALHVTLEWLLYVGVALYALRGCLGRGVGQGVDMLGALWFHEWLLHCLRHGLDPGWTPWFFHPDGMDLFALSGNNYLDAVAALPLLMMLGTPGYFAPLVLVVLLGNVVAMRALLRSLGLSRPAVVAGALIFAFHPYVMLELSSGRVIQAMMWFLPLALRELLLMERDPRWRRPLLAGLFIALQAWTYWFSGYMVLYAFGPALVLTGLRRGRGWWVRLGVAAAVAVVLVLPGVIPMMARLAEGSVSLARGCPLLDEGQPPHEHFVTDAWSLWNMRSSLLQVPLEGLLLLGAALAACRRRLLWGLLVLLGMAVAAGPLPDAAGQDTNPLWSLARLVPGFTRLQFPYRFWAVILLGMAPAVAEAMERATRRPVQRWVLVAPLVYLGLFSAADPSLTLPSTEIFRPRYVDAVRAAPGAVLDLPLACNTSVLHYQPLHGQPLLGGMGMGLVGESIPVERLMRRVANNPRLKAVVDTASGRRAAPSNPPSKAARWLVLHHDLYRDPGCLTALYHSAGGPDAVKGLGQRVNRALRLRFGPPHATDAHASAWDLTRVK